MRFFVDLYVYMYCMCIMSHSSVIFLFDLSTPALITYHLSQKLPPKNSDLETITGELCLKDLATIERAIEATKTEFRRVKVRPSLLRLHDCLLMGAGELIDRLIDPSSGRAATNQMDWQQGEVN